MKIATLLSLRPAHLSGVDRLPTPQESYFSIKRVLGCGWVGASVSAVREDGLVIRNAFLPLGRWRCVRLWHDQGGTRWRSAGYPSGCRNSERGRIFVLLSMNEAGRF